MKRYFKSGDLLKGRTENGVFDLASNNTTIRCNMGGHEKATPDTAALPREADETYHPARPRKSEKSGRLVGTKSDKSSHS